MIILGVETATMNGGAAILADGMLIAELRLNIKTTHSERLLPGIDYLLKQTGIEPGQIDVIAVSHGPGSFTGLRVGLGLVKGMAYASGEKIKVVAVPTMEAFAWHFAFSSRPVCPLLNARKGELYGGIFLWAGSAFTRLVPESVLPPRKWIELAKDTLGSGHDKIIIMGEIEGIYKDEFEQTAGAGNILFAPPSAMSPSPANVAYVGSLMAEKGIFADPETFSPFYISKSEAELKWKASASGRASERNR